MSEPIKCCCGEHTVMGHRWCLKCPTHGLPEPAPEQQEQGALPTHCAFCLKPVTPPPAILSDDQQRALCFPCAELFSNRKLAEAEAQLATLREALAKADKQLRDADKATRRNALITNEKGFVGAWVAMPKENFDKLRAALRGQPAKGHAR